LMGVKGFCRETGGKLRFPVICAPDTTPAFQIPTVTATVLHENQRFPF